MILKLVSVATLFAAGSILVAGNPALGATSIDTHASATPHLRCGGRRCGGGQPRCGGGIPICWWVGCGAGPGPWAA